MGCQWILCIEVAGTCWCARISVVNIEKYGKEMIQEIINIWVFCVDIIKTKI